MAFDSAKTVVKTQRMREGTLFSFCCTHSALLETVNAQKREEGEVGII